MTDESAAKAVRVAATSSCALAVLVGVCAAFWFGSDFGSLSQIGLSALGGVAIGILLLQVWWLRGLVLLERVRRHSARDAGAVVMGACMYDLNESLLRISILRVRHRISAIFVMTADASGVSLWTGGVRPVCGLHIPVDQIGSVGAGVRPGYSRSAVGAIFRLDDGGEGTEVMIPLLPLSGFGLFRSLSEGELEAEVASLSAATTRPRELG